MKIQVNGLSIRYLLEGPPGAPVVTFSHSLGANLHSWEAQANALSGRYRVLRYDVRGHGGTAAPPGPYSLDLLAGDLRGLLAALGIERTHLVGLSLGGMIGQVVALEHPGLLASLTLCDTTSRVPAEARPLWAERIAAALRDGMGPLVEPTLERWLTPAFRRKRPEDARQIGEMIRTTPVAGYVGCCHAIAGLDLTERLVAIRVPTLVLVGEEDPATPVAVAEVLHRGIPDSELMVLPGARHLANVEQGEAFTAALLRFLGRQ